MLIAKLNFGWLSFQHKKKLLSLAVMNYQFMKYKFSYEPGGLIRFVDIVWMFLVYAICNDIKKYIRISCFMLLVLMFLSSIA